VPNAPHQSSDSCTHERRPGTTVCLRCRHAARIKAAEQRNRFLLRAGAVTIVTATFVVAASLGATAIRAKGEARRSAPVVAVQRTPVTQPVAPTADSAAAIPTSTASAATGAEAVAQTGSTTLGGAPLRPIIAEGESPLIDSVIAFRADSVVIVSFDTRMIRTRNPEKFEQFVRRTLPAIYGHSVDSALARLPVGGISRQGNLLSELPVRGVRLPLSAGWMIQLFPETRAGVGGPIVVRYRVMVLPAAE
jgi:hypothetical protein